MFTLQSMRVIMLCVIACNVSVWQEKYRNVLAQDAAVYTTHGAGGLSPYKPVGVTTSLRHLPFCHVCWSVYLCLCASVFPRKWEFLGIVYHWLGVKNIYWCSQLPPSSNTTFARHVQSLWHQHVICCVCIMCACGHHVSVWRYLKI